MKALRRQAVRCEGRLSDLLDHYGLRYRDVHGWQTIACKFHDENVPSLRVNIEEGGFACLACGAHGGDVIAFAMQAEGLAFREAVDWLSVTIGYDRPDRRVAVKRSSSGVRFRPRFRKQ